jgi:hypothetical protein
MAVLAIAVGVADALVFRLLVEMTTPAAGIVKLLALLPANLLPLGLVGAAGAIAGHAALKRARSTGAAPS